MEKHVESKVIAFFGNRYGILSRSFFYGLLAAIKGQNAPISLILVDTSTAPQAKLKRRIRNKAVKLIKRCIGVTSETEVIDWFRETEAGSFKQISPEGHDLSNAELAKQMSEKRVNIILIAGCDQIIKKPLIDVVPKIVNYHNSLLPKYRGCNAVQWAFLDRENKAGYSFHTVESEEIDKGCLLYQRELPILNEESPFDYNKRLINDAASQSWESAGIIIVSKLPI